MEGRPPIGKDTSMEGRPPIGKDTSMEGLLGQNMSMDLHCCAQFTNISLYCVILTSFVLLSVGELEC